MPASTPTRANFVFGLVFVVVFGGLVLWRQLGRGSKDVPQTLAAFAENLSLGDAAARSDTSGRPVFVYATASWCGPCQMFKEDTLSRPDVASLLTGGFEPVYLDIDQHRDLARSLRVMSVPTVIVMRGGQQVDRASGYMAPEKFLAFLAPHTPGGVGQGR